MDYTESTHEGAWGCAFARVRQRTIARANGRASRRTSKARPTGRGWPRVSGHTYDRAAGVLPAWHGGERAHCGAPRLACASGSSSSVLSAIELWLETLALQWIPILHIWSYPQSYPHIGPPARRLVSTHLHHLEPALKRRCTDRARLRRRRADHAAALTH